MAIIKIGICTDVHHADKPNSPAPYLAAYRDVMLNNPNKMQLWKASMEEFQPDIIVQLGDFISYAFTSEDYHNINYDYNFDRFAEVKASFEDVPHTESFHLIGNHDIHTYPTSIDFRNEWLTASGNTSTYFSKDINGIHYIALDPMFTANGSFNPDTSLSQDFLGTPQLSWLEADLANTSYPVVVFCHYRLLSYSSGWSPQDVGLAQAILTASGKVIACFSGHEHLPQYNMSNSQHSVVGGINYFSLDALVDSEYPTASHAKVTIDLNESNIEIVGVSNQQSYSFPFGEGAVQIINNIEYMTHTDYKFWYITRDDNGFITRAAIRFYEGTETGDKYTRKKRLQSKELPHLIGEFEKDTNGDDIKIYTTKDFGSIKTDDELRIFLNKELKKDTLRTPNKIQSVTNLNSIKTLTIK